MRRSAFASLAAICVLSGSAAQAATQGDLGATSSGSISIRVSIAPRVRISVADAAPVHAAGFSESATVTRSACLWSNTATRGFRLIATGIATQSAQIVRQGSDAPGGACARAGGTSASLQVQLKRARFQRAGMSPAPPEVLNLLVVPE